MLHKVRLWLLVYDLLLAEYRFFSLRKLSTAKENGIIEYFINKFPPPWVTFLTMWIGSCSWDYQFHVYSDKKKTLLLDRYDGEKPKENNNNKSYTKWFCFFTSTCLIANKILEGQLVHISSGHLGVSKRRDLSVLVFPNPSAACFH